MIEINFKKNSKGKYDFSVVQNNKVLYKKEYAATEKDETGHTQAQVFKAYCDFLQDQVNEILKKDPNFHWKSFKDFKAFAGTKNQNLFFENELKYLD